MFTLTEHVIEDKKKVQVNTCKYCSFVFKTGNVARAAKHLCGDTWQLQAYASTCQEVRYGC